jgi:hypothetical protein
MHPFKRERLDAAYRYIESLSPEMIAFEFMRRNPGYREDYALAEREEQDPSAATPASDRGRRWGLRFPGGSRPGRARGICLLARRRFGAPCPPGVGA